MGKGLGLKVLLKALKCAEKLNDLLRNLIRIDSITIEFASFQALRNDKVGKNLIA